MTDTVVNKLNELTCDEVSRAHVDFVNKINQIKRLVGKGVIDKDDYKIKVYCPVCDKKIVFRNNYSHVRKQHANRIEQLTNVVDNIINFDD